MELDVMSKDSVVWRNVERCYVIFMARLNPMTINSKRRRQLDFFSSLTRSTS